ncbi:MAG: hypothetical protein C0467_31875 [Planctomycetaceae bacterium]|nr:hypothetical protein [Planctomycetaceae bacterium]
MAVAYYENDNGSIRDFDNTEVAAMEIETTDVRQGGFPTFTCGPDGTTIKATYFCKFDEFERFKAYMVGAAKMYFNAGSRRISRMLPQTWPNKPKIACIKVDEAHGHKLIGEETDGIPVPTYERMRVVFTFQQLPYALREDADVLTSGAELNRYVQVMPSVSEVQYLSLPGGVMQYTVEGGTAASPPTPASPVPHTKPIPYGLGMPIPTITISRKWHRVPIDCWGEGTPLFARVYGDYEIDEKPYVGTVNMTTLFGYPPGYLLYLGVEEEVEYDPLGDELCWSLTHKWSARTLAPHNWLYFFSTLSADAGSNGWYLATKRGGTYALQTDLPDETSLFNVRDHSLLFNTQA